MSTDQFWFERYENEALVSRVELPREMTLTEAVEAAKRVDDEVERTPLLVAMMGGRG